MYISTLKLQNFRVFDSAEINFVHPDLSADNVEGLPQPRLPNINLLLGDNGSGKTTVLKAVALAALGPSVEDSGIRAYRLIRRTPGTDAASADPDTRIEARFVPHPQDQVPESISWVESGIKITRRGDIERMRWDHPDDKIWHPVFSSDSDAFFFVGYGATRRVEKSEHLDMGSRKQSAIVRAQRVSSIFEEAYSLIPLNSWLPRFKSENPGRYKQVINLVDKLLGDEGMTFAGDMEGGEYLFERDGFKVPFPALSDGYRAFLGWVGDLLYHVAETCPSGRKLVDNRGIVMVDEIDLHLHPRWQMKILGLLCGALPNIQFIMTTHSPLLVGSLEWMNVIAMAQVDGASRAVRIRESIHGLDADQILLTDFFKLSSTRAPEKSNQLKELTLLARKGDTDAALKFAQELSRGLEETQ